MVKIAIVEDEASYAQTLSGFCARYGKEKNRELEAQCFDNPVVFLQKYRGEFDLVFMDILMPQLNGMECARRLRKRDSEVLLCFVTSMARYAIQGYEVGAVDFVVKPVSYDEFSLKMDRMLRLLRRKTSQTVLLNTNNEMRKLDVREIQYVEVYNHNLVYHAGGEALETYGKLSALEEDPRFGDFIRVSPSFLVNCREISAVQEDTLTVGETKIPISRRRRKECLEKLASILGGVC